MSTVFLQKARGAFSTDCTYSEEAELSTDGPFVSEIWALERLHDAGIDGSGTTIAVLDSGINFFHPAFKNKILGYQKLCSRRHRQHRLCC